MNTVTDIETKKKEPQSTDEFIKGLWKDNPVFVQVLGMCPVLAQTPGCLSTNL